MFEKRTFKFNFHSASFVITIPVVFSIKKCKANEILHHVTHSLEVKCAQPDFSIQSYKTHDIDIE